MQKTQPVQKKPRMLRFFLWFLLIQGVLFTIEMQRAVQNAVIEPFTASLAWISSTLMKLFDNSIVAQGVIIRSLDHPFAVKIAAGCNGVEATIILFAALLAFPAPWKHKVWGFLLGFLAIHIANLARIITLFYIGQWNAEVFEWAHLYIWQALILLDVIIVWLIWVRKIPVQVTKQAAA